MAVVRVTSKGQATIPKRLREKLGIKTPGLVAFREDEDGHIVVERVRTLRELQGILKHAPGPSIAQIREEDRRAEQARERRLMRAMGELRSPRRRRGGR